MNKKVLAIILATVVALVFLSLYAFGPLAASRQAAKVNPASKKPVAAAPATISNQNVALSAYHNKDMAENFYTVVLPRNWQANADQAGRYSLAFANGQGSVALQDVADNTTLELFILSQDEPALKKSLANYQRLDYRKLTINSNPAFQLTYQSTINGQTEKTVRTYVAGSDQAGVVTLTAAISAFDQISPVFEKVTGSFNWENAK